MKTSSSRLRHIALSILVIASLSLIARAQPPASAPFRDLPRSSPEAQGISSAELQRFIELADTQIDTMNSLILIRHGHIVAEGYWAPYDAGKRHALYSLTKSFTSSAVGLAVSEGRLRVDELVLPLFPEDAPAEPSANLKAMRVRDLLTMSTGHHVEALNRSTDHWTRNFLAQPVEHKPGTFFLYNTPASHMLSAIVQKKTGMTELEYLRPRLFGPLGITDPVWMASPQGVSSGGWGLKLRTRELARFGQLILQKGKWDGRQVLPAEWVETATSRWVSNGSNPESDWDQGYGFQFWRSRYGNFRGDGAYGQYCLVMPERDAVLIITSGVKNMQATLDLVWSQLLPVFKSATLPANALAAKSLEAKLGSLSVRKPEGKPNSEVSASLPGRKFAFPENAGKLDSVGLETAGNGETTLVFTRNGVESRLVVGYGTWKDGQLLGWGELAVQPVAATGAWTAADTFTTRLCFYEEPFILTLNLKFAEGRLILDSEFNVYRGPTKQPQLIGTAK